MANVTIGVRCTPFGVRARAFGGTVDVRFQYPGASARTDEDGRFTLRDLPRQGCHLILRGEGIVPHEHPIDAATSPAGSVIEVDGRCQVQVKLSGRSDRADGIAARDERGQPLDLLVLAAGSTNAYTDLPLHGGASQVFSLSSRARTIVLLKDGAPVGELVVDLQPGRVNVVEG
jgi:hypothetical protein